MYRKLLKPAPELCFNLVHVISSYSPSPASHLWSLNSWGFHFNCGFYGSKRSCSQSFLLVSLLECALESTWVSTTQKSKWDALCNLITIVQFKKREKYPWRSVTFSKVYSSVGISHIFKLWKRYLIAQTVSFGFLCSGNSVTFKRTFK